MNYRNHGNCKQQHDDSVNGDMLHHFFFLAAFFASRATERAIATACFCGLPAFISVEMFFEMVFLEYPFLSGMAILFFTKVEKFQNKKVG